MHKIFIIAVFTAFIAAGCTSGAKTATTNTENDQNSATTTEQKNKIREKNTIEIDNSAFFPASYTVKTGTTIKWVNNENAPHIVSVPGSFQSPTLRQGDSFTHTFEKAGTFSYICAIHTYMKGRIIVED